MELEVQDTDGLVDWLYQVLWHKPDRQQLLSVGPCRFCFRVPDTVIFKRQRPFWWYFTSSRATDEDGSVNVVKRKRSSNLNDRSILQGLVQKSKSISETVAVWYYTHSSPQNPSAGEVRCRYLDQHALERFLLNDHEKEDGTLQVYFDPKASPDGLVRNCTFQSTWEGTTLGSNSTSTRVFLLEKRQSDFLSTAQGVDSASRFATFENHRHNRMVPVASEIVHRIITQACEEIVAHFAKMCPGKLIRRMTLHWKIDSNDVLWLLYGSLVKVEAKAPRSRALRRPFGPLSFGTPEQLIH
eukprot:RCo044023